MKGHSHPPPWALVARVARVRAANALEGFHPPVARGLRDLPYSLGLGSATESGVEGTGVAHPCLGGASTPLTLREPLEAAPGKPPGANTPDLMAWRTTKRSCTSSWFGGSIQMVVGTSPSLARLPWVMATWGVGHLGGRASRIPPRLPFSLRGRGGDLDLRLPRCSNVLSSCPAGALQAPSLAWQHLRNPSAAHVPLRSVGPKPPKAAAGPNNPK